MISPLGRGHRGGTLSITSSRGRGSRGSSGERSRHTKVGAIYGCRGADGRGAGGNGTSRGAGSSPTAEGPAVAGPAAEGLAAAGVGPWSTRGLKE